MKFSHRTSLFLGGMALVASAAMAQTTLYNNLPPVVTSFNYNGIQAEGPIYNSFSTGSAAAPLTDVKLYLNLLSAATGKFTVALYSNSTLGTTPGSQLNLLATLNDSSITGPGVYDVPVNPGIALSANTRYWIVLAPLTPTTGEWATTGSNSGTGVPNEYNCYTYHFISGADARRAAQPHGESSQLFCSPNTGDPYLMSVTVTSPSTPTAPAAAPDLSLTGMAVLSMLLAASAVLFLRRSVTKTS